MIPSNREHVRTIISLGAALSALLLLAACGDTGMETPQISENDVAAYCEQAAALDAQEEAPTEEQLDELVQAAPEEIEPHVQRVADRYGEAGIEAFEDPQVQEALQRLEEWEEQNCP